MHKPRLTYLVLMALVLAALPLTAAAQSKGAIDESLRKEVDAAVSRGLKWLVSNQKDDGSWSNSDYPALTALALQTFLFEPPGALTGTVNRAIAFIRSCVRDDGGIYRGIMGRKGGGLSNYNTAICMTALFDTGDTDLAETILNARTFVAAGQHFGDDEYQGGFGYDRGTGRAYTDLLNTYYVAEGMRRTEPAEKLRKNPEKRADIDWKEARKFIERMQNKPDSGKADAGGFFYKPGQSKAGASTNEVGTVVFRSYGSMTYAGLLSLIYTDVSREDHRVRSALDWSRKHWSLEENPGMGAQGLFFFYNVLTKALMATGTDQIPLAAGGQLNWREEVARKLVSTQKIDPKTGDGFWQNDSGRFWENDPVLSTAYSLIALQIL